jgi:hemoglobin/transferrin/lactoferrin receptor protein
MGLAMLLSASSLPVLATPLAAQSQQAAVEVNI